MKQVIFAISLLAMASLTGSLNCDDSTEDKTVDTTSDTTEDNTDTTQDNTDTTDDNKDEELVDPVGSSGGYVPHETANITVYIEELAEINDAVLSGLLKENSEAHVDLVLYSPYAPWDNSPVRKPGPGMLQVGRQLLSNLPLEVKENSNLLTQQYDEGRSFMAGDREADMGAAIQHGVRGFRVDASVGISGIINRLLDDNDEGDALEI